MANGINTVILDRDGVINHDSDQYIKSAAEWHAIDGSLEAISRLNQAGYKVVMASNQSGVGRGLFDYQALMDIQGKLQAELTAVGGHLDGTFFCPHTPDAHCECRKPLPGMLLDIYQRLRIEGSQAVMVGDSLRDLQAAKAAGAKAVLVKSGLRIPTLPAELGPIQQFSDLAEFVEDLLEKTGQRG